MSFNARTHAIETFRSEDGPHVLLISQVGTTGLNLDFANIMVIVVSKISTNYQSPDEFSFLRISFGQNKNTSSSLVAYIDTLKERKSLSTAFR